MTFRREHERSLRCRLAAWLAGATVSLLAWSAAAQSPPVDGLSPDEGLRTSEIFDELRQVEHDRRTRLTSDLEQRRSDDQRLEELASERKALERAVAALEKELSKRKEAQVTREREHARLAAERDQLAGEAEQLRRRMREYAQRVRAQVSASIPWQQVERMDLVQSILARLETKGSSDGSVSPAQDLEAVASLQTSEESLARLVEAGSLTLSIGSEQTSVRAFRWGLLAVLFANEGGSTAGFCRAGEALLDGVKSLTPYPDAASGYERALDILARRRTPALVDLRIPSLPKRKGTNQ
ncbi:MAG: DUF3450 family protein [Planctomycetota bacterium]